MRRSNISGMLAFSTDRSSGCSGRSGMGCRTTDLTQVSRTLKKRDSECTRQRRQADTSSRRLLNHCASIGQSLHIYFTIGLLRILPSL